MTKNEFQALIDELMAKGMTRKTAERIARKRRRAQSPAHKAAAARRWALAQDARDGRAEMDALRAGHSPRPTLAAHASPVLTGTDHDRRRALELREALAAAGAYRTCDLETTGRHAAAVERARERIAAAAGTLNANDAAAVAGLIELLNAAPFDPALIDRLRAHNDAIAADVITGKWSRPTP